MSENEAAPMLRKWPFYLADLILSGVAVFVLYRLGTIEGSYEVLVSIGCLAAAAWGAWLSISPWLLEYRTGTVLADSASLKSSLEQIQDLEKVADLIRQSNSQWQGAQEAATRTVTAAKEISERMKLEADEFTKFLQNAHNQERAAMRLEIEKLRRSEGEWIKVVVQILDHVFAVTRAAERSGQPQLKSQMGQFQNACRDAGRRIGLAGFMPAVGERFDARAHQLPDPQFTPPENAAIGDVLASGFTYQGQLLRRALVLLEGQGIEEQSSSGSEPRAQELSGQEGQQAQKPAEPEPNTAATEQAPEPPRDPEPAPTEAVAQAEVEPGRASVEPSEESVLPSTPGEPEPSEIFEEPPSAGSNAQSAVAAPEAQEEAPARSRTPRQRKKSGEDELSLL